jgi:hypothetical protein
MKIPKAVIYALAIVGFGYLLLTLFVSLVPIPSCEVEDFRMTISPSKQYEAKLVIEKCQDKTEPVITLNISNKLKPKEVHSVVLGIATTTDIELTWLSGIKLQVAYPVTFQLTQEPSRLNDIEIKFVTKPSSND